VRDASRFVGRSAPSDICITGGSLRSYNSSVRNIVRKTTSGSNLFPDSMAVFSASTSLECVTGSFRLTQTPIATVSVDLAISFPFSAVFSMFGVQIEPVVTTVTDRARVFGA